MPSPGDLPNPGIEPRSPSLQADSLPDEPQGKPKNTGVGSLSLLQWIFSTQESNWGILHCRQILYQLSHKESPRRLEWVANPFSNGSSQPRNQTGVSCIAGGSLPTELSGKLILKNNRIAFLPTGFDLLYFRRLHADVESGEC